jgi:hypothetical protein
MNRDVLKGKTVFGGEHYANDALQHICHNIYPYSMSTLMLWIDSKCPREERPTEFHAACRNQQAMIDLFNQIVCHGEDFAMKFIIANKHLV